jgi:hypothetical protein
MVWITASASARSNCASKPARLQLREVGLQRALIGTATADEEGGKVRGY